MLTQQPGQELLVALIWGWAVERLWEPLWCLSHSCALFFFCWWRQIQLLSCTGWCWGFVVVNFHCSCCLAVTWEGVFMYLTFNSVNCSCWRLSVLYCWTVAGISSGEAPRCWFHHGDFSSNDWRCRSLKGLREWSSQAVWVAKPVPGNNTLARGEEEESFWAHFRMGVSASALELVIWLLCEVRMCSYSLCLSFWSLWWHFTFGFKIWVIRFRNKTYSRKALVNWISGSVEESDFAQSCCLSVLSIVSLGHCTLVRYWYLLINSRNEGFR